MFVYKIGYHTCEESSYVEFLHKNKYTNRQLFYFVMEAVASLFPKLATVDSSSEKYRWANAEHTAVIRESDKQQVPLDDKKFIEWKKDNRYKHATWIRRHTSKPIDAKLMFYEHSLQFDNFFDRDKTNNVVNWLIRHRGFERVQYKSTLSLFGWSSLIDDSDWKESNLSEEFSTEKALNDFGITKELYPTKEQIRRSKLNK